MLRRPRRTIQPTMASSDDSAHGDGAPDAAGEDTRVAELLARLRHHTPPESRFRFEGEIARGGMGTIIKIWDEDLHRSLAMKVALGRGEILGDSTPQIDEHTLTRFLEEAQVTGQLDHPGIVPLHELGVDASGRIYFTMRLVEGDDLKTTFKLVREGSQGWTQARALGVIHKICETMAFAHAKGVLHRDLKPSNVMVGPFGEVYVMDWGLAKVGGREDHRDLRLRRSTRPPEEAVEGEPGDEDDPTSDSPLLTLDGTIVGTPAYMPPEQAEGRIAELGPRADVYSIGAMLYELLTGQMPYVKTGTRVSPHAVLAKVLSGGPQPLEEFEPHIAPELRAICGKAMARDAGDRYAGTHEMGEDLRAYLEGRVVGAYETGPVAELRKWVARNKALALAIGAAVLLAFGSLGTISYLQARSSAEIRRLADVKRLQLLEDRAQSLWPLHPERVDSFEQWLDEARQLIARTELHERTLVQMRARATRGSAPAHGGLQAPSRWTFENTEDQWQHDALAGLVAGLGVFADSELGLTGDIERRLAFAKRIEERSVTGPLARERWERAIEAIADTDASSKYGGSRIKAQIGLLPLGPDPGSGLWEFVHLQSGEPPKRAGTGELVLTEATGIVFVLLPGGSFPMGSQTDEPAADNYCDLAGEDEQPPSVVSLAPFFIAKHEMTQSQWRRATGASPSRYQPGMSMGGTPITLLHPVEQVTWTECVEILWQLGLELPTEAQWEYAARGGTRWPWWTGAERESLAGAVNILDRSTFERGESTADQMDWDFDDGFAVHAPVNLPLPNPFGLHGVLGNVWEWCADVHGPYSSTPDPETGLRHASTSRQRVHRGGSFDSSYRYARCAFRYGDDPENAARFVGVRPARALDR